MPLHQGQQLGCGRACGQPKTVTYPGVVTKMKGVCGSGVIVTVTGGGQVPQPPVFPTFPQRRHLPSAVLHGCPLTTTAPSRSGDAPSLE